MPRPRGVFAKAKEAFAVVKDAGTRFGEDEGTTRAAALAYYAGLSLAPIVLLAVSVAGMLGESARASTEAELTQLLGPEAGVAIGEVLKNAREEEESSLFALVVGLGTLLFSATAVFAELQTSMNRVWGVKAKPGNGILQWLRKRLLSIGMVGAILFLLLVSLVISAAVSFLVPGTGGLRDAALLLVGFALNVVLFGVIYKVLPDVKLKWRDVATGAILTAVLFGVGRWGIGLYLGNSAVGSVYGAAGSLVVLLVWVYYSALIFLFGAEVTQAIAMRAGRRFLPDEHAVPDEACATTGASATLQQ